MKLIFLVIFGVIVNAFCVDSSAVDVAKTLDKPTKGDNRTKFTDLNTDCVLLILERLDYDGLLKMAQIDDELSTLAADVFRHKYSISIPFPVFMQPTDPKAVKEVADMEINTTAIERVNTRMEYLRRDINAPPKMKENEIEFTSGSHILNLFKYFGHAIKKLKISNNRVSAHVLEASLDVLLTFIGKLIGKYSSESLVDVKLTYDAIMLLKYIENPLVNVENVTFDLDDWQFGKISSAFNRLFPSVRRLDLEHISDRNLSYFDYHLPHLEHLSLIRSYHQAETFLVPGVITKNPQIRSLRSHGFSPEFVKTVNTLLPQLETFVLTMTESVTESIQFGKVTSFELVGSPTNLHFPQLQRLRIEFDECFVNEYCTFLDEHNHLSHFYIMFGSKAVRISIKDSDFQRLTAILPNVVEISLKNFSWSYCGVSSEAIVKFLKSNTYVKQLNLINWPRKQKVELQEQLEREWNIRISNVRHLDNGLVAAVDMSFEPKIIDQI